MEEKLQSLVLAQALDRLKACADGYQKRACLTSKESYVVCAYIWWLTDEIARAKEKAQKQQEDKA